MLSRGNVDLTKIFPFFGKTQLEILSVVASLVLLGCHLVTAILVKEKILLPSTDITKYVRVFFSLALLTRLFVVGVEHRFCEN